MGYDKISAPKDGHTIEIGKDLQLKVPNDPIIPFIEGDGTGADIWKAAQPVFDAAVAKAYKNARKITWLEIYAGEKALSKYGADAWLPADTLQAIRDYKVAIKGPLTTPIGGGIRSINVALRQELDLYACVRPVRWFDGVPSPVREPGKLDVTIYRENTEDTYLGVEWQQGSKEALEVIRMLNAGPCKVLNKQLREDSGIGIKPISVFGSKRLARAAIAFAVQNKKSSVTFVHKGNIMKYTEGAFSQWAYEVARDEFGDATITEKELTEKHGGRVPAGKVVVKDRIADSMFQQVLLRPEDYQVIATTNLNGDYLSDACAAQVGGLGLAPGANIGDHAAIFEATHGTAPKYAGQDKINPGSVILSGCMMFRHLGWSEVADAIERALAKTIAQKTVTYDLERQMPGAKLTSCSGFGQAIIDNLSL